MRILVHDYAGHPFQVQLSRGLARRGHSVHHVYSESIETPRGNLVVAPDDPTTFTIDGIRLTESIRKYDFVQRFRREREYARRLVEVVRRFQPEVVLSSNTPSLVQHALSRSCGRDGVRLVSWVQDLYGVAAHRILRKKLPVVGGLIGRYFIRLDRHSLLSSHQVVIISEDFEPRLRTWGVPGERLHVIHNWAPLDELPQRPRDNDWSRKNGLSGKTRFLYSGTLSIRHNPQLLLALAESLAQRGDGELIVVSQGSGMEWLREHVAKKQLDGIHLLPFQPFSVMPDVLGSADVLLAILDPDAGVYCVPSKILTYFCSGRPVLVGIPSENLSARIVAQVGAGVVVPPNDPAAFVVAAVDLCESEADRLEFGKNGRAYAERAFDFDTICSKFESLLRADGAML